MKKVSTILAIIIILLICSLPQASQAQTTFGFIDEKSNRTIVPLRYISETLGAEVKWDPKTSIIEINKDTTKVILKIGAKTATIHSKTIQLDTPPVTIDGRTYVPLRFISEAFGADVKWDSTNWQVIISDKGTSITLPVGRNNQTTSTRTTVKVGNKNIAANVIKVDLRNPSNKLKVAIAKNQIGQVDSLANIAKQHQAKVAINGTFFDSYTAIKEPYGTIVTNGEVAHIARDKTVFGFNQNNQVRFDILNPRISGQAGNQSWYAYWLNRTPNQGADSADLYTKYRGATTGISYGTNIVVADGKVKEIKTGETNIPANGYVLNLQGSLKNTFLPRFQVGNTVDYTIDMNPKNGQKEFWNTQLKGAVGAGPRLITNGSITITAKEEGFTQPNILSQAAARSAVGVTKDHYLLFVTTTATMNELARVMQSLGAVDAMNLDGGASSGMYYNGKYITTPGRNISNALLVY